ncbi:tetratricopeptide repeat protein [Magnetovibrio sp. PR-2]|uniref:tetratricopeptide repeat protein n=1 Tax=Magnetovibrio sp. PR-2 TaxID=3120356 RepID=UPI002FCDF707
MPLNPKAHQPTVQAPAAPKQASQSRISLTDLEAALSFFRDGEGKKASSSCWKVIGPARTQGGKVRKKPTKDDQAYIYFILAQAFLAQHDFANAQSAASRSIALVKNNPQALDIMAQAMEKLGDLDGAQSTAEHALKLTPTFFSAFQTLTSTWFAKGYREQALSTAQEAVRVLQNAPQAQLFYAHTLRRTGQNQDALKLYSQLLKRGPAPDVLVRMGHIFTDLGQYNEAIDHYDQALKHAPNALAAWHGKINALVSQGHRKDAQTLYKRAVETVPDYQAQWFDFLHPLYDDLPAREKLEHVALDEKLSTIVNAIATFPSLPLGPALIKSSVEAKSNFRVLGLDLNTDWYAAVVSGQRNGTAAFTYDETEAFLKAAKLFTEGGEEFFDNSVHNPLAETFSRFENLLGNYYNDQCQRIFESDGPTPWYVDQFARHILSKAPKVVAMSVMFTEQFWFAALLAKTIKLIRPDVLTVFGGGFFNEVNLEDFLTREYVDHVILHEGEMGYLELLQTIERDDEAYALVTGLARFNPETGSVEVGQSLEKMNYEDQPFADFSDYDMNGHFTPAAVVPLISSRGCYWRRCTFCDHFASYAGTYKTQSIVRCVDEIEYHVKHNGVKHFTFVDEMISAKRFQKIGNEILKRGLDVRYYALAKPTPDFTQEILDLMYESGCRCVYWGLESGSERLLELMDKGNTVESSSNTLNRAHKANIRNHLFIIVGFPSETRAELDETIAFLYEHANVTDKVLSSGYVLKKGTPIHDQTERFGLKKVYAERSTCNSKVLNYDSAKGLPSDVIHPMAEYLQIEVFDKISPRGSHFGTPRNHIIIVYGEDDLPPLENTNAIPTFEDVKAKLDEIKPTDAFMPSAIMVPHWTV